MQQLDIKTKLLEKSGFDEVFHADSNSVGYNVSDMNSIKETLEIRNR